MRNPFSIIRNLRADNAELPSGTWGQSKDEFETRELPASGYTSKWKLHSPDDTCGLAAQQDRSTASLEVRGALLHSSNQSLVCQVEERSVTAVSDSKTPLSSARKGLANPPHLEAVLFLLSNMVTDRRQVGECAAPHR